MNEKSRMHTLSGLCMLCGFLLWASCMQAQERKDTITGKVHDMPEVMVQVRRAPGKVTSAVPIQVLSQKDIHQLGVQDMADAVRRFAGTSVKDYGGIGGLKTVSVRNMGAAHTAVSYDGVAVSNCQAGQIDIGRFSLDNIALLSMAIGQNEDLLQSARLYASAGVLSLETQKPHFEKGKSSAFQFQVKGGAFGMVQPSARWWQCISSRTRLSVDGSFLRADGNYPFTLVNGKYVTREKRNNSAIDSWQGEANLYHTFKDESELRVKGYYFYSKRGLPGAVTLYNSLSDETLWDENVFAQAKYRKRISDKWSLQALGKYTHGWNKYVDLGAEYVDNIYQAIHRQDEYYLSGTALYCPLPALSVSVAQDGYVNTLRSNLPECPFPTRYTSQTALNVRWAQERFTATGTLNQTFITESVKYGEKPENFYRLAPTLSFNLRPWAEETFYLRLMYKSTFRTPTFNDLYYSRLGNRNLRPEKANEYNIGITWSHHDVSFLDYLSITIDGYYNQVTDKIVAFPTTYAWRMANYGKVRITGLDATLGTSAQLGRNVHLSLTGNYTWQRAIDLTNPASKSYKHQLPYTPEHNGNVAFVLETPWIHTGYSIVAVSDRYCLSQDIPENRIDGYVEHTLSLSKEFTFSSCKLRLQGEIINLTDQQYDVIKYYPMPGRSWRLSGTIKF